MACKEGIGNPPKNGTQAQCTLPQCEFRYLDKQNMCVCGDPLEGHQKNKRWFSVGMLLKCIEIN